MSPLARLGAAVIGVGLLIAVVTSVRSAFDFGVVELAERVQETRRQGELRDQPGALPFTPTRARDLARPSPVEQTSCARAEIRALTRAGWRMWGHSWSAGDRWRVEAFQLEPPDRASSSLDAVREVDARCPELGAVVLDGSLGLDRVGWVLTGRNGRPTTARGYVRLRSGRVQLVTVLAAPRGDGVLPALTTTLREAFTPVPG